MANGSAAALKKKVNRAGFFRWGADGVKRLGNEFVNSVIEQISDKCDITEWFRIADEKAVGAKPRLYFTKGNAYFIVNDPEQGVFVFAAGCPEEGGFLEWQARQQSFYCSFCQSFYDRLGQPLRAKGIALTRAKAKVIDGQVWVRVERPAKQLAR